MSNAIALLQAVYVQRVHAVPRRSLLALHAAQSQHATGAFVQHGRRLLQQVGEGRSLGVQEGASKGSSRKLLKRCSPLSFPIISFIYTNRNRRV